MATTITPNRWFDFIGTEYLENFIRDGGSSIKFAVPFSEPARRAIASEAMAHATEAGYFLTNVSAHETRVHMVDQIFFRVAEQIPWRRLSTDVIVKLAELNGYRRPADGTEPLFRRIGEANNIDAEMVQMEARTWIAERVFRQRSLAKDFRVAVTRLCLAELSGGPDGETIIAAISDWLTGRNKAISAVRPYQIFSRIDRSNARHMLESLLRWVQFAGHSGVIVMLDISRLTVSKNPHDESLFYTKAAMLDAYEVLRQFIDSTDRMVGCLLVVTPDIDFLTEEQSGRGIGAYDALKLRVYDEIHDQRLVNPMAALIRLSSEDRAE